MIPRRSGRFVSRLTRSTMAMIMAGGRGSRLEDLTAIRAKPATPFGGKFRIIDFPLSNCVNSGIRQIFILTQYKAHSLIQHIHRGWGYLRGEFGEFIQIIPAQQQVGEHWYRGTADSIYQNINEIREHNPEHVLILAGDHIYKMDYGPMIAAHSENNADVTVGVIQVPLHEATGFGVMSIDTDNRVKKFSEKPVNPEPVPGNPDAAMASMGIYVFDSEFLIEILQADAADPNSSHDFGHDIIPKMIDSQRVFAYPFHDVKTRAQSYWRDVGTVDAYFRANLELVYVHPELNLYDEDWPIWTYQEQLPPAKFVLDDSGRIGMATNSMVSGGCIVSGAYVKQSLLFSSVTVDEGSEVIQAVVLPQVSVGKHCRITRAVIDKRCVIPDGTIIGENHADDAKRFTVTSEGVVLVCPHMLGQETKHSE
ncbi:MAG: glucose-1-phosphate adenylyltransferase [Xanthomonadales bacterium]|nr:glucose-1-phosphate adenylyltransferase [Gammaproteobacteria bacterium]MBT8051185.1 glucose-1-phosphate adenylyltransferase [Gammaproteobacteria bacterium]NNJ79795.1 glucose-1-phosphate adenylyltransferase [Xanthomonadales bacterium]NNL04223.1 glucose-1-phosphate adenylyltransferase [Xanthomonadales bacterium]